MANLLQSSQTQATSAPSFYTNYLSNLASQGQTAATGAEFAGIQPLQQKAFDRVEAAGKAYQPTLQQAGDILTKSAGVTSPLAAGAQYISKAAEGPGALAKSLMNPFTQSAVQGMSDIAQRNIQQNLAPQATAAAVGSGQFGSQRGAQVLGQMQRQAEQDLNTQIAQMLSGGYGQALQAATAQQNLLGQLGQTTGTQASQEQQNLTEVGRQMGALAGVNQNLSLADINALATLGGQQQTIAQNQQMFPLTKLASLSALLQGQQIPSTVTTQLQMSPFSALGALGAGGLGMMQPRYTSTGTEIPNSSPLDLLKASWSKIFPSTSSSGLQTVPTEDQSNQQNQQLLDDLSKYISSGSGDSSDLPTEDIGF